MSGAHARSYVLGKRDELAELAHEVFALDRFRPEACVVVGNYFSLRGEHEKAILYFRRALRADPGYTAAWTLIGHEFVEVGARPAQ